MEKKRSRKKLIIILVILGVLIIAGVTTYILISGKSSTFSFSSPDFSAGAGAMDKATAAGNSNAFENTKLNPFENSP